MDQRSEGWERRRCNNCTCWKQIRSWRGEVKVTLIERTVATNDGVEKARDLNVMFIETSAKTKDGINELFDNLIEIIVGEEVEGGDVTQSNPQDNRVEGKNSLKHRCSAIKKWI